MIIILIIIYDFTVIRIDLLKNLVGKFRVVVCNFVSQN